MTETTALKLAFVDGETTGLDARIHQMYEFAWAIEEPEFDTDGRLARRPSPRGPVNTAYPAHDLKHAEPVALDVGKYFERGFLPRSRSVDVAEVWTDLRGATLVAANPAFDQEMMTAAFGFRSWHYRLIDVEAMAYQELRLVKPAGLFRVAELLRDRGFEIPEPDHTAAGDVHTVRECYYALIAIRDARAA